VSGILSQLEEDPADLLAGLTAPAGDPFLRWVTGFLQRASGADYAFVGELRGEDLDSVRVLAVGGPDGWAPGFEYGLADTPCCEVVSGKPCFHPRDVQALFPEDALLREMSIESYAGTPLLDGAGRPVGLVVLLGKRPWPGERCDRALQMLAAFRPRIEAELVGRRVERELELIVEGAGSTGEDAISALTLALARALQVKCTFVCERIELAARMRTLSLVVDGRLRPDFEFDCAGTPCEAAYDTGCVFVPSGVCERFPEDDVLRGLDADGYLGIVFFDGSGEAQGHLGLVHDGPLSEELQEHPLVKVFAARAASEVKRMRAEHARLEAERRLLQGQRLESLGLLAGGIAHDFNNLLVGILGHADILRGALPEGTARDRAKAIIGASERAAALCKELLAYAGRGSRHSEPVDLNALVTDISRLLSLSISQNCEVRRDLAADLPAVDGDSAQLQQVVMNLITNASEALADEPGVVTLSTKCRTSDEDLFDWTSIGQVPTGECVVLEVRDSGAGFGANVLQRLFDPFFTTKSDGRGLGLASALGIVRGHGGAVCVRSVPGAGTTFRIVLPASTQQAPAREEAVDESSPSVAATVLVVDDQEMVRDVACTVLELNGFDVMSAGGGREALALLEECGGRVDCVLLDWAMPGFSGEATLLEIKRLFPSIPVVISSGDAGSGQLPRTELSAVAAFLDKPYTARDLVSAILGTFP